MAWDEYDLFTWRGRVSRTKYSTVGITCFAIKYLIDRLVSVIHLRVLRHVKNLAEREAAEPVIGFNEGKNSF